MTIMWLKIRKRLGFTKFSSFLLPVKDGFAIEIEYGDMKIKLVKKKEFKKAKMDI